MAENEHHLKSGNVKEEGLKAEKMDNILSTVTIGAIQVAVAVGCSQMTYATVSAGSAHWAYSYGAFRDVNIMIFFGFGFLMTFLHRHGLSAVGYCLIISALVVECSIPVEYLVYSRDSAECVGDPCRYPVNIENLMNALFCAGAVMISYGAVIGKVTPFQLIVMTVIEVFAFWLNLRFVFTDIGAHDVGGGMVIHTFGAYFGIAATFWVTRKTAIDNVEEKSIYSSDIFSLAGTIFLWVLWPSFQSAVAGAEQRQFLAVANTFVSLCSSTLAFAVFSRWLNNNKFDVVHMQNATLAGGVVMGVAGDMDMGLHGAMISGFAAGLLSCLGYSKLMPFMAHVNLHDTCGVNNLHGMPGILGSIVGIIVTAQLGNGEPAAAGSLEAPAGTAAEKAAWLLLNGPSAYRAKMDPRGIRGFQGADEYTGVAASDQAIALIVTIAVALVAGTIAGICMTFPLKALGVFVPDEELFNDRLFFGEADDYEDNITKEHSKQLSLDSGDAKEANIMPAAIESSNI